MSIYDDYVPESWKNPSLLPSNRLAAESALRKLGFGGYAALKHTFAIRDDGLVDVVQDLHIAVREEVLPVRFSTAIGSFYIDGRNLSRLDGFPKFVGKDVKVSFCRGLTSLTRAPTHVGLDAEFTNCGISSLDGCPVAVGRSFLVRGNSIEAVTSAPESVGRVFDLSNNLIGSLSGIDRVMVGRYAAIHIGDNPIRGGLLSLLNVRCMRYIVAADDPYNGAVKIINKYLGSGARGIVAAQREMIDSGLDEYAEM